MQYDYINQIQIPDRFLKPVRYDDENDKNLNMNTANNNTKPFYNTVIPGDWDIKSFENIAYDLRGGAPLAPKDFTKSGFKVLPKSGVCPGGILHIENGKQQFCSFGYSNSHRNNTIDKSYTIIVLRDLVPSGPNIGLMVKYLTEEKYILAQGVYAFKINEELIENDFLIQFTNGSVYRRLMQKIKVGSTQVHITNTEFLKILFPLPPLPEQRAIAQLLTTWDTAINKSNKVIAQKQLRKKWLMQNLLTGRLRLRSASGERFGGEWNDVKLGEIFTQIKSINDGGNNHSIMTISSKLGLISQKDKFDRVIAGDSLKKYTQLKKGDFAYNKGNSKTYPMGCIYQLEEKESALVPFVYICFRPADIVDSKFFKHWFLAHGVDRQLKRIITSGARGDGLLNVNKNDFFSLKIICPPKKEQAAIAKVLQTADKEIKLLTQKLDYLKEQKKGMMQQLLTGKKRLKQD